MLNIENVKNQVFLQDRHVTLLFFGLVSFLHCSLSNMGLLQDFPHVKYVEPYSNFRVEGGNII